MNRSMRAAGMLVAATALVVAPWVGAVQAAGARDPIIPGRVVIGRSVQGMPTSEDRPLLPIVRTGCGCDQVVIDAINELRDAEVETGDATVRNVNVTFISAAFMAAVGEFELEVDQRADAVSGDAIAGQILAAVPAAGRCANVLIKALNLLEDVELKTGDAIAVNRNIVLLDPGVDRNRIDFDIDQDANATAGSAVAGQVIGASGGGDADGCGSVTVEATNSLEDVDIETGESHTDNENTITTCAELGCGAELLLAAKKVGAVRMCTDAGCRMVPSAELIAQLEPASQPSPEPLPSPPVGGDAEAAPEPSASAEPGSDPEADPEDESDADLAPPSASPSPTPASA